MMERVIFDTDLYIDWLQNGAREELMVSGPFLRYMSTVVLMELRAGALLPSSHARCRRAVHDVFSYPSDTDSYTGHILASRLCVSDITAPLWLRPQRAHPSCE